MCDAWEKEVTLTVIESDMKPKEVGLIRKKVLLPRCISPIVLLRFHSPPKIRMKKRPWTWCVKIDAHIINCKNVFKASDPLKNIEPDHIVRFIGRFLWRCQRAVGQFGQTTFTCVEDWRQVKKSAKSSYSSWAIAKVGNGCFRFRHTTLCMWGVAPTVAILYRDIN